MNKVIFETRLTDISSSPREPLGTLRWEGGKVYKYVMIRNTGGTVSGAKGDLVSYASADGYKNNHVVIRAADANTIRIGAGLLTTSVAGQQNTSYYGWIQVRGHADLGTAPQGSPSPGHRLVPHTNDKTLARADFAGSGGIPSQCATYLTFDVTHQIICDFPL